MPADGQNVLANNSPNVWDAAAQWYLEGGEAGDVKDQTVVRYVHRKLMANGVADKVNDQSSQREVPCKLSGLGWKQHEQWYCIPGLSRPRRCKPVFQAFETLRELRRSCIQSLIPVGIMPGVEFTGINKSIILCGV